MKSEDLLKAVGYVEDELVEGVEVPKKKRTWLKWSGAAAAVLTAVIGWGIYVTPEKLDLPMLALTEIISGAAGGGGVMLYDITELETGNPWNENAEQKTLPVYKNLAYSDGTGMPVYRSGDAEELLNIAEQTAAALSMESGEYLYHEDDDGNVYQVELKTDQATITVEGNMTIYISYFDGKGVSLPESFDFSKVDIQREQAEAVTDYLVTQYQDILGFKEPQSIPVIDYSLNGDLNIEYLAYDNAGGMEEQMLHYNFGPVRFYLSGNKLTGIRIYQMLSAAEKIGDYPLISEAKARKQLLKGDYYYTAGWEEVPDRVNIAKVELTYLASNLEEIFVPCYKYWVESPEEGQENGLKSYQIYYVPAVEPQYLE